CCCNSTNRVAGAPLASRRTDSFLLGICPEGSQARGRTSVSASDESTDLPNRARGAPPLHPCGQTGVRPLGGRPREASRRFVHRDVVAVLLARGLEGQCSHPTQIQTFCHAPDSLLDRFPTKRNPFCEKQAARQPLCSLNCSN